MDYYILKNGIPTRTDAAEFAVWFADPSSRRVDLTELTGNDGDDASVSTVFLGLDHAMIGGPPVLFETMAFTSNIGEPEIVERYTTLAAAKAGHWRAVDALLARGWKLVKPDDDTLENQ